MLFLKWDFLLLGLIKSLLNFHSLYHLTYRLVLWLQDGSDEIPNLEGIGSSGFVEITTTAAILFVVIASCFLVMLYKLMSKQFIEILVVLFCIGGVEVRIFYDVHV